MVKRVLTALCPHLLLVFLALLFFLHLFTERAIFYTPGFGSSDIWQQNFPLRDYVVKSLKAGHLPLWVPELGQGFPLLAEGQIGFFNLINLVPSLLFPSWSAFNMIYLLIFLLMSTATYAFVRSLKLSQTSALLSAVAFTFSAKIIVSTHHINLLLTLAFLPLNLWLVNKLFGTYRKTFDRDQSAKTSNYHATVHGNNRKLQNTTIDWHRLKWMILFAFGLSQQFLAGHPQIAFYSWVVILTYGFVRVLSAIKLKQHFNDIYHYSEQNRGQILAALAPLFVAFLLAVGLSAVQLLPMAELVKVSTRAGGVTDLEPYPFRPKHLLMLLRPDWFGNPRFGTYPIDGSKEGFYWENVGYIGLIPLFLAIFAISFWIIQISYAFFPKTKTQKPKPKTITKNLKLPSFLSSYHATVRGSNSTVTVGFFILLIVLSIVLALGKASPFFFLLQLPPFNFFRVPARFLLLTVFSLSILSGFGLEKILNWCYARFLRNDKFRISKNLLELGTWCLVLLTVLDLWSFGWNYNPTGKIGDWLKPPATAQFIKTRSEAPKQGATLPKVAPLGGGSPNWDGRIADIGSEVLWNSTFWKKGWESQEEWYRSVRNSLTPDSNLIFDVPSTGVYAGIVPVRSNFIFDLFKELGPKGLSLASDGTIPISDEVLKLFSLTNTRYLISGFPLKNENLKFLYQTQNPTPYYNYGVWENTKALSRAYFATSAVFVKDINEAKKALLDPTFSPQESVIIETPNFQVPSSKIQDSSFNFKISWVKDSPMEVELTVETATDGWLVLSDSFYPGWKAYVDGKETPIFAANVNGRGIKIQTGQHQLKFLYQPQSLRYGMVLSTVSFVIALVAITLISKSLNRSSNQKDT